MSKTERERGRGRNREIKRRHGQDSRQSVHQLLSIAMRMLCEILQNIQKHKSITGSTDRRTGQSDTEGGTEDGEGSGKQRTGSNINQRLVVG